MTAPVVRLARRRRQKRWRWRYREAAGELVRGACFFVGLIAMLYALAALLH